MQREPPARLPAWPSARLADPQALGTRFLPVPRSSRACRRLFYLACSELFNYDGGNEWGVSHFLMQKRS